MFDKRYTAAEVIANEFGWDIEDVKEIRYHQGWTDRPLFATEDGYWCATRKGQNPAKHRSMDFEWKEYDSKFADSIGWQIWKG